MLANLPGIIISAAFIKNCFACHSLFPKVINLSLIHRYVPESMKSTKVIPLFKSGDTSDVGNYRPISILPVVSKILERPVCD